ncbi:MAG TPA: VWA domain-containing protein [Gemmatimonadaceae bacterium]
MRRAVGAVRRLVLKTGYAWISARGAVRATIASRRPTIQLGDVQRRLELLLTAMYGRPIPIAALDVKSANWVERVARALRDPRGREGTPTVDAESIHLPAYLSARDGVEAAVTRYRLLALEAAERLTRGTPRHAPLRDPLELDLFLLREGAAIDSRLSRAMPGMSAALAEERNAALSFRPQLEKLTRPEREVELLLRSALAEKLDDATEIPTDPEASLAWAKETAARIRSGPGSYRGLPPASLWGTVRYSGEPTAKRTNEVLPKEPPPPVAGVTPPASSTGWHRSHSHDAREGIAADQTAESVGKVLDEKAPSRDHVEQSSDGVPSDEAVPAWYDDDYRSPARAGNGALFNDDPFRLVGEDELQGLPPGIQYDEWNSEAGVYLPRATTVRLYDSADADDSWSREMLDRHAALVRQIRHHFERLRARRALLGRQRAGDELDLMACVNAMVDRRIGHPPDDRLYLDARPARRGLAISLLVDVSGSTETRVTDDLRIVDLERISLLLASEALDALGDLYAVHSFAGKSISNVKLTTIKSFAERNGEMVRRRIAAMQPGGFTRLGAAVRHVTRQLARESAGHRLLLILSDGRPNDVDRYQGPYGVEDARQAILEARASGVFPFCITVDRDASEYLPRIFGTAGHTVLQRAEQLPTALLRVVQGLLRRA